MLLIALFAVLVACTNGAILPPVRIVGGSNAAITEAPYTVALLIDLQNNGIYTQACGGVIITRTAVLTSAQCTTPFQASRLRIRAGSSIHSSGGQLIQVATYKNHESFSSANYNNDLSILYLATQILLSTSASTITLPAQGATIVDGSSCMVTGWGRLSAGGSVPANLQKMTVPSVNQNICISAYSGVNTVTTNMFCAGRHGIGGIDVCQGDTGGPLAISGILHGIASWGRGCGEPQYPGVYTRIAMYRNWLNTNT